MSKGRRYIESTYLMIRFLNFMNESFVLPLNLTERSEAIVTGNNFLQQYYKMDRKGNDFLFSGLKGADNQKKIMQKIQQDKESLKISREQGDKAVIIQRYLRSHSSRMTLFKRLEGELLKNVQDLEKLSSLLLQSKGQIFYLPLQKLVVLLRNYNIMTELLKKRGIPKLNPNPGAIQIKPIDEANLTIVQGLGKWVTRGLEKPEHNLLLSLFTENETFPLDQKQGHIKNYTTLMHQLFLNLPKDPKTAPILTTLLQIYKGKKLYLPADEKAFDKAVTQKLDEKGLQLMTLIRIWLLRENRLEIHVAFESIPNERRLQVTNGIKLALSIVANFIPTEKNVEAFSTLMYGFVNDIVSLPTINKYWIPFMKGLGDEIRPLNFKTHFFNIIQLISLCLFRLNIKYMYQAFYSIKQVDMTDREKEEAKLDMQGNIIGELDKNESKMFRNTLGTERFGYCAVCLQKQK